MCFFVDINIYSIDAWNFYKFSIIPSLLSKGCPILTWSKASWCNVVLDNMRPCIENCCVILCRLQPKYPRCMVNHGRRLSQSFRYEYY